MIYTPSFRNQLFIPFLLNCYLRLYILWIEAWQVQKCPWDGPQISRACPDQGPFLRLSSKQQEASRYAEGCVALLCSFAIVLVSQSCCLEDPSLVEGQPSLLPLPHPWPSTLQLPCRSEKVQEGIQRFCTVCFGFNGISFTRVNCN